VFWSKTKENKPLNCDSRKNKSQGQKKAAREPPMPGPGGKKIRLWRSQKMREPFRAGVAGGDGVLMLQEGNKLELERKGNHPESALRTIRTVPRCILVG